MLEVDNIGFNFFKIIKKIIIILLLSIIIFNNSVKANAACPCSQIDMNTKNGSENKNLKFTLCLHNIDDTVIKLVNSERLPFTISFSRKGIIPSSVGCSVIIFIDYDSDSFFPPSLCPNDCFPLPKLTIPVTWFLFGISTDNILRITCSLTSNNLFDSQEINSEQSNLHNHREPSSGKNISVSQLLQNIVFRRIAECKDHSQWPELVYHKLQPHRMKVHGLILWVGSNTRPELKVQQAVIDRVGMGTRAINGNNNGNNNGSKLSPSSLLHLPHIGWSVDDHHFSCSDGSTVCHHADKQGHYMPNMPLTLLHDKRCNTGWACAQRRPLRALSHALLLFDPLFVLLVDDDTYVNLPLLLNKFHHTIHKEMVDAPLVVGNYIAPRYGQLSPKGFYLGGAGYLIGQAALNRLVAKEIYDIRPHVPRYQAYQLSILKELKNVISNSSCKSGCLLSDSPNSLGYVPLASRLVDVCTALMAGENTCHHSDHSVSRCLFYGFRSQLRGVPCGFQASPAELQAGTPLMCGHVIAHCNLSTHVTCHRWRPTNATDVTPISTAYLNTTTGSTGSSKWLGCLPD